MSIVFALARYTLKEHLRHRVYLSLIFFALLLFGGSAVAATLAPGQRLRLLLDLGLAGLELTALIGMTFLTVNLILREMETRTIYLILTHPVPRSAYVLGRFLGTLLAVAAGMAVMAVLHLGLLFLYGWPFAWPYAVAWICILGKITVIGVMALLMSLFSSSANTAMVFTIFLWGLGHFTSEMTFLAQKSGTAFVRFPLWLVQNLAPNLSYFSYHDFLGGSLPPAAWYGWLAVYCICYSGIGLYLSAMLIEHKEF